MRMLFVAMLGLELLLARAMAEDPGKIRYAVIGDSYSIGEGAGVEHSWPVLLTRHLVEAGVPVELVSNPSRTGWSTAMAISAELPIFIASKPTFATLQIGVNDWVQGVPAPKFRENLVILLDGMLEVLADRRKLLVVTIPDFSVTPAGARFARGRDVSAGLTEFNKIIREEAEARKLQVVDVFPLSLEMGKDPSLVAADGLHPSAKEYAEWEKKIFLIAHELLTR